MLRVSHIFYAALSLVVAGTAVFVFLSGAPDAASTRPGPTVANPTAKPASPPIPPSPLRPRTDAEPSPLEGPERHGDTPAQTAPADHGTAAPGPQVDDAALLADRNLQPLLADDPRVVELLDVVRAGTYALLPGLLRELAEGGLDQQDIAWRAVAGAFLALRDNGGSPGDRAFLADLMGGAYSSVGWLTDSGRDVATGNLFAAEVLRDPHAVGAARISLDRKLWTAVLRHARFDMTDPATASAVAAALPDLLTATQDTSGEALTSALLLRLATDLAATPTGGTGALLAAFALGPRTLDPLRQVAADSGGSRDTRTRVLALRVLLAIDADGAGADMLSELLHDGSGTEERLVFEALRTGGAPLVARLAPELAMQIATRALAAPASATAPGSARVPGGPASAAAALSTLLAAHPAGSDLGRQLRAAAEDAAFVASSLGDTQRAHLLRVVAIHAADPAALVPRLRALAVSTPSLATAVVDALAALSPRGSVEAGATLERWAASASQPAALRGAALYAGGAVDARRFPDQHRRMGGLAVRLASEAQANVRLRQRAIAALGETSFRDLPEAYSTLETLTRAAHPPRIRAQALTALASWTAQRGAAIDRRALLTRLATIERTTTDSRVRAATAEARRRLARSGG